MKKLFTSLVIGIALMMSVASAATQITGITASARNAWHLTEAAGLIRADREVGEQFMANKWDATPWDHFYGSGGDPADAWVMFDLGQEYDLDEIRLWNADIAHGDAGLMGWYVRNMSIHVAGEGATLPSMADGLGDYFTDASWTNIWDGDLAQGPGGTAIAQNELVDPQLILDATGNNGVRYVAIDIDSRYDGANGPALLGHIQIHGVQSDEIANISAIRTALHFVEFEVTDVGASELLPGTVSLSLDGNDVTAGLSVDKDGGVTTIRHEQNPQFLFGATIMYEFSAMDSIGQDVEKSGEFKTLDPDITVSNGLNFLEFNIRDVGASVLQPGTISVTIDGTNVTGGLTVNKVGDVTTVRHDEVPQFAFGATVNYIFAAEDSLGQMIQLDDSFMVALRPAVASAATQITGITGTARSSFHITTPFHMIDPTRQSGDQAMAGDWDPHVSIPVQPDTAWPWTDNGNTDSIWLMFDLGQEYDLEEIRLWNLDITHGDAGTTGWHVENMSIHVAGDDAVLPSTATGLGNYFTDASWTNIWDGDLAHGPEWNELVAGQLIDPELVVNATAYKGVRYVAIDVDSNYRGDNGLTGMQAIQIYGVPGNAPPAFAITDINFNSATSELNISWESDLGFLYNIRGDSEPADAGDPATWGVILENIEAAPPINTSVIPIDPGANPLSLFVVERFLKPPVTILAENFDDGDPGWTTGFAPADLSMNTVWELGNPSGGLLTGPPNAFSGANCYGTNIGTNYGIESNTWLRSPSITLQAMPFANLSFRQWLDIDPFEIDSPLDHGQVRVLAADDLSELGVIDMNISGLDPVEWTEFSGEFPAAALGQEVILEFRFLSDNDDSFDQSGWYIDDVAVSAPAP